MAHLQNPDKRLFPPTLKVVVRVPEKGLPSGSRFENLSENYNKRGISQTPGYARLGKKLTSPAPIIRLPEDVLDDMLSCACFDDPFAGEYVGDTLPSDADEENQNEGDDDRRPSSETGAPIISVLVGKTVLFVTPDKNPWKKQSFPINSCGDFSDSGFRPKQMPKRRTPLCRGMRK